MGIPACLLLSVNGMPTCLLTPVDNAVQVPYFNAPMFLQNKTQIGKIEEIFGAINDGVRSWVLSNTPGFHSAVACMTCPMHEPWSALHAVPSYNYMSGVAAGPV